MINKPDTASTSASIHDDEWKNWPNNCRNFRPGLDDSRCMVRPIATNAALDIGRPASWEVFHITTFSSIGQALFNKKVSEEELPQWLQDSSEQQCAFRLFFPCSLRGWECATQSYMWRWYSRHSVPVDAAFTFAHRSNVGFKTFMEVSDDPGPPAKRIRVLHLWLTTNVNLETPTILEYYTEPVLSTHTEINDTEIWGSFQPVIYIQYDLDTRVSTILLLDYSPIYRMLEETCKHAPLTRADVDPFVFLVTYLRGVLVSVQSLCDAWSKKLDYFGTLIFHVGMDAAEQVLSSLSEWKVVYHHTSSSLDAVRRNTLQILEEHRKFAATEQLPAELVQSVDESLIEFEARAARLAVELKAYTDIATNYIEILLGLSQLQNGIEMRRQATATETIARDAKRDSQIMKTITIVTLIYLPATFVCTLLGMGIFEWPTQGDGKDGVKLTPAWWIFLAIAIPLSIVTCGISFAWMWYTNKDPLPLHQLESTVAERGEQVDGPRESPNGPSRSAGRPDGIAWMRLKSRSPFGPKNA